MKEQADHIRSLLSSGDEAQQAQGRELLRSLNDGALYAAVLDGWAWEELDGLGWSREGDVPFSSDLALEIWRDAPIGAPFPPSLALDGIAALEIEWPGRANLLGKLRAMPRLRHLGIPLSAESPPFPFDTLPPRIRRLAVRDAQRPEDLAGIESLAGVSHLELHECALPSGPLPLPPRLAKLTLWAGASYLDPGVALAGIPLRHLRLANIPHVGPLAGLTSLRSLRLSALEEDLPSDLGALRELAGLDLSFNGLKDVPPAVLGLPRLRHLDLSLNFLASLPPEMARLSGLRRLGLDDNPLEELPPALSSLRELRRLSLSRTRLQELPPWLADLPRLEALDVSGAPLQEGLSAEAILRLPRLRWLCLGMRRSNALAQELVERAWKEQGRRIELWLRWGDGLRVPLSAPPAEE